MFYILIMSTSVDTANLLHFIQAYKYCRIFFRLFDFLGGAFNRLNLRVVRVPFYASAWSSVVLKNAKKGCRGKLCIRVWLLQ